MYQNVSLFDTFAVTAWQNDESKLWCKGFWSRGTLKRKQYMFPHMGSRHHLQSNNVVLRDPSSVQSRFTFIWHGCFSPYSRCSLTCDFTRVVSGFQDGSSLEKHLRGTTGRGSLEFIIKSPVRWPDSFHAWKSLTVYVNSSKRVLRWQNIGNHIIVK